MTYSAAQESSPGQTSGGGGTPEERARRNIERLLGAAGWHVCGVRDGNIHAARGVAIREFSLSDGQGGAD